MSCPQGEFELKRYPRRKQETLQAWNGADLLLLDAAGDSGRPCLVVNDEHGALAIALSPASSWTDSALSARATQLNCSLNAVAQPLLTWSTEEPQQPIERVFMRVPKSLPYFEYQLAMLARSMSAGDTLFCAGMDKHLSPQTATIIQRYFGEVQRAPGKRKAHLFSAVASGKFTDDDPGQRSYHCPFAGGDLIAGPNVFSGEKLDIGSRFLLEHMQQLSPVERAADLACGNGVLGISALQQGLAVNMLFVDESAMAIEAARNNCERLLSSAAVDFHHGDGLLGLEAQFELVLCNPPFHLGHTVDDYAGRRLLKQAADSLVSGGSLVLVANRHLPYATSLRRLFKQVDKIAQNGKFIVWRGLRS